MLKRNAHSICTALLIFLPLLVIAIKQLQNSRSIDELLPREVYSLTYEFDLFRLPEEAVIRAYLPQSNQRQLVRPVTNGGDSLVFDSQQRAGGVLGSWRSSGQRDAHFSLTYEVEVKAVLMQLPTTAPLPRRRSVALANYLQATDYIQSDHPTLDSVAGALKRLDLTNTLKANFAAVQQLESSGTNALTDALTAWQRQRASCNGQSRLFVALCRAQGIPARVVGGLVLENAEKRTSHLWAEVYYNNHWIPFDPLNGHFAYLPAHYLELYQGDEFLMTHTSDIGFDYQFSIQKKYQSFSRRDASTPTLWSILGGKDISFSLLRVFILLPVAALIVALMKNVVGLKTFGVFLPALIGLSVIDTHLGWTILAFVLVLGVVSGLHYLLEKMHLLHTPKLVIMLISVVVSLLALAAIGHRQGWADWSSLFFLPLVILAITAERYAKTLVEEGFLESLKMLGTTLLIAALCYPIFTADLLMGILLTYPELYLSFVGVLILLGRWIGLRVFEYQRFASLPSA